MSDDSLTPPERLALLALISVAREVTNAELKTATGIELLGPVRRRLNERKLVTSEKRGRPFVHALTDAGWARCVDEMAAPPPDRPGRYGGVLFASMAALHRYLERTGVAPSEIFTPDVAPLVRATYARLADGPAAPVRLNVLRAELGSVSRPDLDAELRRMADQPGVHLRAVVNQQTLTDADREAALRLGGEDRHNLQVETP